MSNTEFQTEEELQSYIKDNILLELGEGSEGTCYKTIDNQALKVYEEGLSPDKRYARRAIKDEDIGIDTFLFPTETFTVGRCFRAYKTRLCPKDLLKPISNTKDIDIDKFKDAFEDLYNDVVELSNKNILIVDLPRNLLFTGDKFYVIDTIDYKHTKESPLNENLRSLIYAIREIGIIIEQGVYDESYLYTDFMYEIDDIKDYVYEFVESRKDSSNNRQYTKR